MDGSVLTFSIPLSYLGNDSSMDLFWAFAGTWTADFERSRDVGVFDTEANEVVVRRPGTKDIHVDIEDFTPGSEEPSFPNLRGLQADVVGDQLQIVLTYAHTAEVEYHVSEGMQVFISIDSDQSLCSGFKNAWDTQPTFGVDYELKLNIDSLTGELWLDENDDGFAFDEVRQMGLHYTDMLMQISGSQVICHIPLSTLALLMPLEPSRSAMSTATSVL